MISPSKTVPSVVDLPLEMLPRTAPRGRAVLKLVAAIFAVEILCLTGTVLLLSLDEDSWIVIIPIATMPLLLGLLIFRYMRPFVNVGQVHYGRGFSFERQEIVYEKRMRYRRNGPVIRIPTGRGVVHIGTYRDRIVLDVGGVRHALPRFYVQGDLLKELSIDVGRIVLRESTALCVFSELFSSFYAGTSSGSEG